MDWKRHSHEIEQFSISKNRKFGNFLCIPEWFWRHPRINHDWLGHLFGEHGILALFKNWLSLKCRFAQTWLSKHSGVLFRRVFFPSICRISEAMSSMSFARRVRRRVWRRWGASTTWIIWGRGLVSVVRINRAPFYMSWIRGHGPWMESVNNRIGGLSKDHQDYYYLWVDLLSGKLRLTENFCLSHQLWKGSKKPGALR